MVKNILESNFQSFIIFFPHSSYFVPFQSASNHSNQTVQRGFVHLPATDMQADCLTANKWKHISSANQNIRNVKIIL